MDKDSVLIFKTPNAKSPSMVQRSPGNNPFDDLLKKTIDTATMTDWQNRRSSLQLSGNFPDFGRQSLSFHELSGFGRESMGILPPDFGRDSLGFMNLTSSEIDRESLGILQMNAIRESLSFRRESIGILNLTDIGRESLDCGRESLGILHLKSPDVKFGDEDKKIPEIILTTIQENSDYTCNPLDTAFLNSYSRKSSATSSTISSVTPSFNSCSLEEPSGIYSSIKKAQDNNKSNSFNKAFNNINADEYSNSIFLGMSSIHSPLNKGRLFSSSELLSVRSRIQSLPVTLEEEFSNGAKDFEVTDRKFWTTDRTVKTKTLERRSFHATLDFGDTSNDFLDSVFIEGHHIAEKIADGSILNESFDNEVGILDCTPQPNWPEEASFREKETDAKCDQETVFKTVDKMLPPPIQDIKFKLKTSKTDSNSSNENSDKSNASNNSKISQYSENDSKLIQNMSNITRESDKYSVSRKSHSISKDAKEMLHNLSEILNCTHRSDQQKSEGQNLLSSLADMLSENNSHTKPEDPDDSGRSSINEQSESPKKEDHKCFEVLDLRTKSCSEDVSKNQTPNKTALDLSLKTKSKIQAGQRLTQSFSSRKSLPLNVTKKKNASTVSLDVKNKSVSVNSSVNSNNSKTVGNASRLSIAGKLRPKSVNPSVKKGPLKAVIPVGDMKKRCSLAVTPERTEQRSSTMQSKRTSTPINEPKLRPMAASTPAGRPEKDRTELPSSNLRKLKKVDASAMSRNRSSTPTSLPRALNVESKLLRRNSVSDIKKSESVGGLIKRSNSVENESGIMSSLAKVRQNIINSPYYQSRKPSTLKESNSIETGNKTKLDRSKGVPVGKTTNSISKLRIPGKENMGK